MINKFLIHHKTQKSIPIELVQKLKNASKFNQGFATTEYLASALIDLKIHEADPETIDIETVSYTHLTLPTSDLV